MEISTFERVLRQENYAENTIMAYLYAIRDFYSRYPELNKKNLLSYRTGLINTQKPRTVNQRIHAINKYLRSIGKEKLRLQAVKIQEMSFIENVISQEDYEVLKRRLKEEEDQRWYFAVRYMTATGARVSELIQFKVEHVQAGYIDIYSKGGKCRRLYIPASLKEETLHWVDRMSGYLFMNRYGQQITTRGVANRLAYYAKKYGIDPAVVHPHAFRHLYAKNFLERHNDIALLADLLGHESISTTRIYLRKSTLEQQVLIDRIVDW